MVNRPPSADPAGPASSEKDGAYNVRSVPVRIYLPEGPVLQDLVPPNLEDGMSLLFLYFKDCFKFNRRIPSYPFSIPHHTYTSFIPRSTRYEDHLPAKAYAA